MLLSTCFLPFLSLQISTLLWGQIPVLGRTKRTRDGRAEAIGEGLCGQNLRIKYIPRVGTYLHYDNLSLKITLKNYSYSENRYYKRKCCTENFSVLCQCNFQRCLCLTRWERFKIGFSHNNSEANRIIIGFKFSVWL